MNQLSLRISLLAALAFTTSACSAIVAGRLADKPSSVDAGNDCVEGRACNPGDCLAPGICDAAGVCVPGPDDVPDGTLCGASTNICVAGACQRPTCGDGVRTDPESCDDGNRVDEDACKNDCTPGVGDPCASAVDGSPCEIPSGVAAVCASNVCGPSKCSDGVVDMRTEFCDDGNTDPGDGCEPDCTLTCAADLDCSDGNECTGIETCDLGAHTCIGGVAPAPATDCTTPDGVPGQCNFAKLCAVAGCGDGAVVAPEECEDGNSAEGDGCDNDCTWSCHDDPECEAVDACTYLDTCDLASHVCVAGPPVTCTDGGACEAGSCDSAAGCSYTFIDGDGDGFAPTSLGACGLDCDDSSASVHPGAPEICGDGVANDCSTNLDGTSTTWYVDCDGDGFAADEVGAMISCAPPAPMATGCPLLSARAWTARRPVDMTSTDCYDANGDVRPDQARYFASGVIGRRPDVDFDYDCDGSETPLYATPYTVRPPVCVTSGIRCSGSYWSTETVPACGAVGVLNLCAYSPSTGACAYVIRSAYRQSCR